MKHVHVSAPINIALIKYWGKQDQENVIPYHGSLSLSLEQLRTHTEIFSSNKGFSFNLNQIPLECYELNKMREFLKHFTTDEALDQIRIESHNDIPTGAGVASSASGFAALSLAAKVFFDKQLSDAEFHQITRLGSGSACRSLYAGAVVWEKTGEVYPLAVDLSQLKMMLVLVSAQKKVLSSREAMRISVETSPYYTAWVKNTQQDLIDMKQALLSHDFMCVGHLMEKSFLAMHATMTSATPPIHYMTDQSWHILDLIRQLRATRNISAYCTMDAGPNVKILYQTSDEARILKHLHTLGEFDILISTIGEGAKLHTSTHD